MDSLIEGLKCVCGFGGLIALKKESQIFDINNCLIHNFITSGLLITFNIDSCGISDNGICFCLTCKKLLLLRKRPNYGIFNGLP